MALATSFAPQRTVQFIAYAAEEVGLEGSDDIAATYLAAGTDVVAVLQQDMTGYNGSVEDMSLISDFTDPDLTAFLGELLDSYQPTLLWTTTACGYGCSDHVPVDEPWLPRGLLLRIPLRRAQPDDSLPERHRRDARRERRPRREVRPPGGRLPGRNRARRHRCDIFSDGFESNDVDRWSSAVSP